MDELERLERKVERLSRKVADSIDGLAEALRELKAEVAKARQASVYVLPWNNETNGTVCGTKTKGTTVWYAPLTEV